MIAVSVDPPDVNRSVRERNGLDFPVLSDPDLIAIDAFGVRHDVGESPGGAAAIARPAVFVLDEEGRIVWRHLTDNWRIRLRAETVLEVLDRRAN